MTHYFKGIGGVTQLPGFKVSVDVSPEAIEDEPMLFQSSIDYAARHGGPITAMCLGAIQIADSRPLRIDTKVHMLMPGMFPCIGGWHCDWYDDAPSFAEHTMNYMFVTSGPLPEFAPLDSRHLSCKWSDVDRAMPNVGVPMAAGTIVKFDSSTLHRGAPWDGTNAHWRYFFRATAFCNNDPRQGVYANKIRRQVQVYRDQRSGW